MNALMFVGMLAAVSQARFSGDGSGSASGGDTQSHLTPIYIATLLPYHDHLDRAAFQPSWGEGLDVIPAMELAVRHVQQKEGFLDGYRLQLIHENGGCDISTITYNGLATVYSSGAPVIGMIGPGCSASTLATLPLLNRTSIIAVHGAGSPAINRTAFPNSFGTLGSSYSYVSVVFALMTKTGWRRFGILTDPSRPFFEDAVKLLRVDLPGVHPDAKMTFSSPVYDFFLPVADLKESLARIIFVFTGAELARRIMCLAFHEDMFHPKYQWVIFGRTLEEFVSTPVEFNLDSGYYSCSANDLTRVLEGNFLVNYKLFGFEEDEDTLDFTGVSYREYLQEYNSLVMEHNSKFHNSDNTIAVSVWATYFYDAVWAWAIVLDNVTKSDNFSVEEYQFDQPNDALIKQFEQVDFEGVSGHIKFANETGLVDRFIDIFLVSNATEEYVAYYSNCVIYKLSERLHFIDDTFNVSLSAHVATATLFLLLLFIQTLIVLATQIAVVVYRDFKTIKATSPKINHLAYVGVYLLVIGFFLATASELYPSDHDGNICQATWAFFFPYGFILAFGTICVRTWRLYRIFVHYLNPGKFISEPALFTIVVVLLSAYAVVSIVWTSIDPFAVRLDLDDSTGTLRRRCNSEHYFVWLGIGMGFCFLELLALLALTLQTRNIRNKTFQTVNMQVLVYCTFALFGLGLSLYFFTVFLATDPNIPHALLGIVINLLVLLYISCVFMPPIVPLIATKWRKSVIMTTIKQKHFRIRKTSQTVPLT